MERREWLILIIKYDCMEESNGAKKIKKLDLIQIHVHLKPFQCFDNHFQFQLVSFAWVLQLLNEVTTG